MIFLNFFEINLFLIYFSYVGDCQIAIACDKFLDKHGIEILSKSLFRNFVLHLTNLFDYGLLSPEDHFKTMTKLRVSFFFLVPTE